MNNNLTKSFALILSSCIASIVFADNNILHDLNEGDPLVYSNADQPNDPKDKKRKPKRPPPLPQQVFVDVNGDGSLDKVAWGSPRHSLSVTFLGYGDGTFIKKGLFHGDKHLPKKAPKILNFADVTNDGRADKIVTVMPPMKKPRPRPDDHDATADPHPKPKPKHPPKTLVYLGMADGTFSKRPMGITND
ncbi:VCBS repeat-containing protein [Endozoicomonas sp. SM1973]|uniref:VCBS repeat-containing protein n=1 Tax=Spartinivicinus marinus TaxID=2994442 RepID=A0A853I6Z2_9GAMM|nr:FG-GAP-like repeat-containing protein [Spartinivicinus marinus]MCX4027735.1 FG-GAP-like repeat-containing protein [Spartinivicinus marinus]NYZ68539.1 VCBS repeat-containing protein [Spartinivicinus marinus]